MKNSIPRSIIVFRLRAVEADADAGADDAADVADADAEVADVIILRRWF